MGGGRQRVELVGRAWRKRSLRRLGLAVAGFRLAELAVWIALAAYAYGAGGVSEASAVTVAELVPATACALAVGRLIHRFGASAVLRWGLALQSAAMLVAAVFLRQHQDVGAFGAAIVGASAVTTTRPAQSASLPSMVDGPDELTAANVFFGALVAAGELAGPLSAAILMTTVGGWAVFAVMSAVVAAATAAVWRLPPAPAAADEDPESIVAGIRATARAAGPRVMVIAIAAYYVVIGALDVLAVVIAVELLHESTGYAGFVTTAIGAGCLVAGALAVLLIGRRWIAPWILVSGFAIGIALVGVSLAGSRVALTLAILVGFGVATAAYELTALMLLQRVSRIDIIANVFALVETLQMAMLALGAAIVPLAVHLFGPHWAPAAVGVLFAAYTAAIGASIVLIDRSARVPITEMGLLRSTALFGALPGPALETIAREVRRVDAAAGTVVVEQGAPGEEYFAVVSGTLVVSIDGTDYATLGRGDGFGEIALLRDAPRAATVRAVSDATLLAMDREPFITAVTGHAATNERASSITAAHLRRA